MGAVMPAFGSGVADSANTVSFGGNGPNRERLYVPNKLENIR
ncbi:hypothetical protein SAMN02982990_03847 [Photorhabdus luminescens]|uniref:Uncharacterized protein n=1 Tax=Photorhabdus luminescens TaxID=29488 RepID=A0A1G5RDA9_PHOLU|nr:hypothetical protein SAMN02982990_03847 [Photorhabdus luminescens]